MDRVAVVGSGGAGKSTFSRRLGELCDLPVVHLDEHYWKPGWVETPREEWRILQGELLAGERWIADGNYGGTLDVRLARADTVIVLALSRWHCVCGVLRRFLRHRGEEIQARGCPERLSLTFVHWVWNWPTASRPRLDSAIAAHAGEKTRVIELRSRAQVRDFLADQR